jgi:putative transcriptional regulator
MTCGAFLSALAVAQVPSGQPSMLLIASPKLTHPVFREAVVLVTRHGGGTIGIILNRPLKISLGHLFPSIAGAGKHLLHRGGPLQPEKITYLFRGGEPSAETLTVAERTYVASSLSLLDDLLSGKRAHTGLRVVNGYAGWAAGQLENEIARGDWVVLSVDDAAIFDVPAEETWLQLYRRATALRASIESAEAY